MSAQQSLDVGASTAMVPVIPASDRHGSGQVISNPDCSPGITNAPGRGVQFLDRNMFTSLLPQKSLRVGMTLIRVERCYRCNADTSHLLKLIEKGPNTWESRCLQCRP